MRLRFWPAEDERRPDPAPLPTDDRKVVLVGTVLWLLALVGLLIFLRPLLDGGHGFWLWTTVVGLALGLAGLVYTSARRQKKP